MGLYLVHGFIGGWIFYRDRKRGYVAPRFKEKVARRPRPTTTKQDDTQIENEKKYQIFFCSK